jgi:hypothetical protein
MQELRPSAFGGVGLEHYFGILRPLAYFDQRAVVLADRAEVSLQKLWLRSMGNKGERAPLLGSLLPSQGEREAEVAG